MKNNTKRKGFTLVELLVVVAILAILAGVSVVGYISFTRKANFSNDQSMIKMINDNLSATSVEHKPTKPSEALEQLFSVGFNNDKLKPFSKDHHYAYSLEENKFYLLDDEDKVVFPQEKSDSTSLWGLYRNDSNDVINNVTKYIALEAVTNQQVFDLAFKNGGNIDLNRYILNVKNNSSKEISATNGSISKDITGFTTDESVKTQTLFNKSTSLNDVVVTNNKAVVENYYVSLSNKDNFYNKINEKFGSTTEFKEIILSKLTFDGEKSESTIIWDATAKNVHITIEDCIFTNFAKWAYTVGNSSSNIKFTIKNNQFINCGRGINVQAQSKLLSGSEITNNTFNLSDNPKSKAIQLANITDSELATLKDGEVFVKIEGNKLNSGVAFINLHETLVNGGTLTVANLSKVLKLGNNNICSGAKFVEIDIPDKPYTPEQQQKMNEMKDYILQM